MRTFSCFTLIHSIHTRSLSLSFLYLHHPKSSNSFITHSQTFHYTKPYQTIHTIGGECEQNISFSLYINMRGYVWSQKKMLLIVGDKKGWEVGASWRQKTFQLEYMKIKYIYGKKKFISFTHPKDSCHLHLLKISSRNHFETFLI